MENSVKFVRMVTGEDIISEVTFVETDGEKYYILNNPLKVVYVSNGKSSTLSVSLIQWVFWRICDNQDFTVYPKDILMVHETSESMEEYYWSSLEHFEEYKDSLIKKNEMEEIAIEDDVDYEEDQNDILNNVIEMLKDSKRTIH
jgi:hypothetical protein